MNYNIVNSHDVPLSEEMLLDRINFLENIIEVQDKVKIETDITLLKEKELNQTKSRFVSIASHEFRTFLTRIHLSASLIKDYHERLDQQKINAHLDKIKKAVGDLTAILDDFLSVEKIDSCKIDPVWSDFDLKVLAEEVINEMQILKKTGQRIKYVDIGTGSKLNLDKKLLKHCLVNLISNAIKYSSEDGCIELTTDIQDEKCHIQVKDDGIGIPEADQKRLFEAFFRANNTGNIQGTGLGLNIVKRYTELMKGQITMESVQDVGTTFMLFFSANS
ncbi:sensor histidine kinase KdpD [Pedobacter sp. L105]|uniref:sensor histidine kinase n=1 Tax=Pedobacter sp. L105 TaxID=1641871 RepID=UPI00131AA12C|nr:HAMP domain-containing sensor histidine kinase [Pedobacter sp. L105]